MQYRLRKYDMGVASILSLFLLLTVSLADDDHDVAKRLREKGEIIPMEQILQTVGNIRPQSRPVRVLEITLQEKEGRFLYDVEYVDAHGIVWKRQYDAKTGTLLQTRKGE
jgi:uncharacterized membrane protein YkoI